MKLNVQFFWLVLVLSSAMVCGCAPVRTTTYDAMVRSCNIFHRQGWDDGMNRQWFLTQSCRHKPSSSAASITQTTEESAKHVSIDALWSRLEVVAEMVRERSSTGGVFTRKQIDQQDPTILNLLEANAGVSSEIPTTVLGLTKTYLTKGGGGFIVFSMIVGFLFRMSLIPVSPLGVELEIFSVSLAQESFGRHRNGLFIHVGSMVEIISGPSPFSSGMTGTMIFLITMSLLSR